MRALGGIVAALGFLWGLATHATAAPRNEATGAAEAAQSCSQPPSLFPASPFDCECFRVTEIDRSNPNRAALEGARAERPDDDWLLAAHAAYHTERPGPSGLELGSEALQRFVAAGDARGEAYVRTLLARIHQRFRRSDASNREIAALDTLLDSVNDPVVHARYALARVRAAEEAGEFDRAYLTARRATVSGTFAGLPPSTRSALYGSAASMALRLNRFSEALALNRRQEEACRDLPGCETRTRRFRAMIARGMATHGLASKEQAANLTLAAYEDARKAGSRWSELLQVCEAGHWLEPPESLDYFDRCANLADELKCEDIKLVAEMMHTVGHGRLDPARLPEAIDRMKQIAVEMRELGSGGDQIAAYGFLAQLYQHAGDEDAAVEALSRAIYLSELDQDRQWDAGSRIGTLGADANHFHRLARLLLEKQGSDDADLERAYQVVERFRRRAVMVERARADGEGAGAGADRPQTSQQRTGLRQLRRDIQAIQQRLPAAAPTERGELLRELDALELDERSALRELARQDPGQTHFEYPQIPDLESVRAALEPGEALISYQLPPSSEGSSWAWVIDRASVRTVQLPVEGIERTLGLYLGFVSRRDGAETAASDALSAALIAPVLRHVPMGVSRLTVIPDGRLHGLPFAALPIEPGGPPLALTYSLSFAGSIGERVRQSDEALLPRAVLGIAGAGRPGRQDAMRGEADPIWPESTWTPLAWAQREVARVVTRLGGDSLLLDADSPPSAWEGLDLRRFGVLHLASHAVSNHEHPQRSAVLIPARSPEDDGLLQPREIAHLDLDDTLVVLAACSSAGGPGVRGGGPLSLARSFLAAGAPAVIGTLWPVRDDEAARFSELFYDRFAAGEPAQKALNETQQALLGQDVPAADWAAFVLIGDGQVRLAGEDGGEGDRGTEDKRGEAASFGRFPPWLPGTLIAAALLIAIWGLLRRRR
ncbi:hypothetical protein ABI59_10010 [Acidobacteria bacterium Mor1]|nr:hypothetical protein ABI59_10010 [Acidobacteria bacterium Mor1]